jgi:hypothetical protein
MAEILAKDLPVGNINDVKLVGFDDNANPKQINTDDLGLDKSDLVVLFDSASPITSGTINLSNTADYRYYIFSVGNQWHDNIATKQSLQKGDYYAGNWGSGYARIQNPIFDNDGALVSFNPTNSGIKIVYGVK